MKNSLRRANWLALLLTLFACSQMIGHVAGSRALRGIGAASCVAPWPKVFSDVDGLETFASSFELGGVDANGMAFSMPITAELYQQLEGAYNRRNVYGAALSYGPRLPESLWTRVFCYAFAENGPLRTELGLPDGARDIAVTVRTKTKGRDDVWVLKPDCSQ